MRGILKFLLATVVILVICYLFFISSEEYESNIFYNVEALANGETGESYICYGLGCIDCPDGGEKVQYVLDHYLLY